MYFCLDNYDEVLRITLLVTSTFPPNGNVRVHATPSAILDSES